MVDILIAALLALIMFSIGLNLRRADFGQLTAEPRVLLLGLFLQLVWLPFLAYCVVFLFRLPPEFAIGVCVLAACPGGLTSNFVSYLFRANTSLAVSLTICNTTLSLLTVPLYVNLALWVFGGEGSAALPFWLTVRNIVLVVLVPVLGGMFARARARETSIRLAGVLRYVNIGLLGLLFVIKLFAPTSEGGTELSWADVGVILPAMLLINFSALASGYIFGVLARLGRNARLTLGVEIGVQNTSLAFLLTGTLLANEEMLKPALIYAMFTFWTALAYGFYLKPGTKLFR